MRKGSVGFAVFAFALVLMAGGLMTGCQKPEQLEDGYQFGDLTRIAVDGVAQVSKWREGYCQHGDPVARSMLLTVVRAYMPEYPPDGICTDDLFLTALTKALPKPEQNPM